ncbi:MAG: acylphosphatase [Candidatus Omnitrophica bacterium]|nr:acylphosphatase [Candidatus Omnitrophota bacterium]
MQMKQAHIFYIGAVQGVGFRYRASQLAQVCKLLGWVKNLSDGRVEIIVEGQEKAVEEFIRNLDEVFEGYIQNKQISWLAATNEFEEFSIRY